jgi:uncharacterized membrane protein
VKRIRSAFITGFLVLVPLLATIDIILWLIHTVETNARKFIPNGLPFDFEGMGVILAILLVFFTGLLTQNYMGKWLVGLFDSWIRKISVVGSLYGAIKKLLETIFNPSNDQFSGAVLVEFPREGIYSIGFRTGKPHPRIMRTGKKNLVNVFVPCTPNPTSGFYILVPEDKIVPLELSVQEAIKVVISMGIVTTDDRQTERL